MLTSIGALATLHVMQGFGFSCGFRDLEGEAVGDMRDEPVIGLSFRVHRRGVFLGDGKPRGGAEILMAECLSIGKKSPPAREYADGLKDLACMRHCPSTAADSRY